LAINLLLVKIAPPSPKHPSVFVGKKLVHPKSKILQLFKFLYFAPKLCAASSIIGILYFFLIFFNSSTFGI